MTAKKLLTSSEVKTNPVLIGYCFSRATAEINDEEKQISSPHQDGVLQAAALFNVSFPGKFMILF